MDLFDDPNMHLMFEKQKKGGLSSISHRLAKANVPEDKVHYNSSAPALHLLYVDATNLYGIRDPRGAQETLKRGPSKKIKKIFFKNFYFVISHRMGHVRTSTQRKLQMVES